MNELSVQKTVQTLPEELKMNVFNALNNPDYKISDCYGQQIEVQAWLVYPVEMKSQQTGEIELSLTQQVNLILPYPGVLLEL